MKYTATDRKICIALDGRIDTNNAAQTEKEIFDILGQHKGKDIVFDADTLEYISSAGLRVLMKVIKRSGRVTICNASSEVYEIFDTTGFTELMTVGKRFREMSVDGCEVIGQGFFSTVYRVDEETIVKVYHSPDSLPMIRNEQRLAKRAFVKGVPTAISYDIVKVGDEYGSVFELLKAKTFNDHLVSEPEEFDSILKYYYDDADETALSQINDKIKLTAMVRFLYLLASTDLKKGELGQKRIKRAQKNITELLERVGSLM